VPSWPDATYKGDKRRLAILLLLLPFIILLGAITGNRMAPIAAGTHPVVSLAERIWMEEKPAVTETTDASRFSGHPGETIIHFIDALML
jgi:hypothetical protein